MAGHEKQHALEYGGSPVGTEFPGQHHFRLVDRIPHLSVSHQFDEQAAREVRYCLVATVGPERPFYHRYRYVVLDVRMVNAWSEGGGEFVSALRERLKKLGGDLFVVTTQPIPGSGSLQTHETPDAAIAAAKALRAERRAQALQA